MAAPTRTYSQKRPSQEAAGSSSKKSYVDEDDFDAPGNFEEDLEFLQVSLNVI